MKTLKTRRISSILAVLLALCMAIPVQTGIACADTAATYTKYVATGDSITAGYGLETYDEDKVFYNSPADCYAQLTAGALGCSLVNLARAGETPGEYLERLNNPGKWPTDIAALKDADLITINIGQVNVMEEVLYEHLLAGVCDILHVPRKYLMTFKGNIADAMADGTKSSQMAEVLLEGIEFDGDTPEEKAANKQHCQDYINGAVKTVDDITSGGAWSILTLNYTKIRKAMIKNGIAEADMVAFENLFEKNNLRSAYDDAYSRYTSQLGPCIEKIRSINGGKARMVFVGYYDPVKKLKFTDVLGKAITLEYVADYLGSPFSNVPPLSAEYTGKMNTYLKSLSNSHISVVDITDMPEMSYKYTFHPSPECHEYIYKQLIKAVNTQIVHEWDSGTVTKEATETEEGNIHYHCTLCTAEKDVAIPKKSSSGDGGSSGGAADGGDSGDSGNTGGNDSGNTGGNDNGSTGENDGTENGDDTGKDNTDEADSGDTDTPDSDADETQQQIEEEIAAVKAMKVKAKSASAKKNGRIVIRWAKPSGHEMDTYSIYRATSRSGKYTKIATVKSSRTSCTNNKKLKKGRKYYYKVRGTVEIAGRNYSTGFGNIISAKCRKNVK